MAHIDILIGSTLGSTEYVAEHLAELFEAAQISTKLHYKADFSALLQEKTADTIWLVVTATHGAGQVPDNLEPFAEALAHQKPQLFPLRYGIVALGDHNYDTFCAAGKLLDQLLDQAGAQRIGDRAEIDVIEHDLPEDAAEIWLKNWLPLIPA